MQSGAKDNDTTSGGASAAPGRQEPGGARADRAGRKSSLKARVGLILAAIVVAFLVWVGGVAWLNSSVPAKPFAVQQHPKVGATFISTLASLIEQEADRGWIPNDRFWPTVLLDNLPNFQMGQWEVWKRTLETLRDHISRVRTSDSINQHVNKAAITVANDPEKWVVPSFESKMADTLKALRAYQAEIQARTAPDFYPRADNLRELVLNYSSLMGGLHNKLLASVPKDAYVPAEGPGDATRFKKVETSGAGWTSADDLFYHVKGVTYALYHILWAVKFDFRDVLDDKNAVKLVNDMLYYLSECVALDPWLVLNSELSSWHSNHLANIGLPLSQARAKMLELVEVLEKG